MPYEVRRTGARWCVHKQGEPASLGCHPSRAKAERQMAALYAAEPSAREAVMPDPITLAVKFADGSSDTIEGWLAPYGGPDYLGGKDFHGEYFSGKTDFALEWFGDWQRPLLYSHGLDGEVKAGVIGRIKVEKRDRGLWMQAQLDVAHEYHEEIRALVEDGGLGASSGSVAHLVTKDRKSGEILTWPVIEGSLTPAPANPQAEVGYAVKSADAVAHLAVIGTDPPASIGPDPEPEPVPSEPSVKAGLHLFLALDGTKEGRRNSTADADRIQAAHDTLVSLGAMCSAEGGKSLDVPAAPVLAVKAGEDVVPASDADMAALKELLRAHAIQTARDELGVS